LDVFHLTLDEIIKASIAMLMKSFVTRKEIENIDIGGTVIFGYSTDSYVAYLVISQFLQSSSVTISKEVHWI
jgi:hypothetical protein